MKHIRTALCAIFSFWAVSCTQIDVEPENIETNEILGGDIIEACSEQPAPSTRTALAEDSTSVVWSSGDKFTLISSDGVKNTFGLISGAGQKNASFAGTVGGSAPYYAVYPASDDISISEGVLNFKLAATQTYAENSFGPETSPAIAKLDDPSTAANFKNLCGLLCIRLQAVNISIKKIVLMDLAGNQLWGDCKLTLDGAGTADQKMEITGGDNKLTLEIPSTVRLLPATPKSFYFVVPAGALDRGFAAVIYDVSGAVYNIAQTQNAQITAKRSTAIAMAPLKFTEAKTESADVARRGYYKDIFMDGGIALTSRTTLPAATTLLNWDMEYFASMATDYLCKQDTTVQKAIIQGETQDANGVLLYPDGEPRFRAIYINGGKSTNHGKSLEATGRQRIIDFVDNGGGYTGTCAGSFIACKGYDSYEVCSSYLGIFPGHAYHTSMSKVYTGMTIPEDSPLLKYSNFGGDSYIDSVYHNGGSYMSVASNYKVEGTEICLRYANCPKATIDGRVSCWAYKPNEESGRMVLIGSHPEGVESGERRDLMGAMLRYAVDGNGCITTKCELKQGRTYDFKEKTGIHAAVGDRQYHHFTMVIPSGAKNISINLEGTSSQSDLYLSLKKDSYAYFTDSDYVLTQKGCTKSLNIKSLDEGTWYVSVYCPNTVTSTATMYGGSATYYKYTGNTEVLNGIPYTISVDWE